MQKTSADDTQARLALLRGLPYFAGLDAQTLQAIAASMRRRDYAAGEMVLLEGEPCAGLLVVQSGRVKVMRFSLQGREQIFHLFGTGECFNDVAVFDGGPNPASAQAMEDSVVLVIERQLLMRLMERYAQLAQAVVGVLATRCRELVSMVETLALRSVTARLAGLLLDHAGQPDPPTLTRAEMAACLGTVREMVSRSLRELEQAGLIQLDGSRIVITDRAGLRQRAEGRD